MDPIIEALDNQIKLTDTVKSLHSRDEEIITDLNDLKEGQEQLNTKVNSGFEKGRKRMDEIEDKMKIGFESIVSAINNKELKELREEIRDTKQEKKDKARDTKGLKNGLTIAFFSVVFASIITYFMAK